MIENVALLLIESVDVPSSLSFAILNGKPTTKHLTSSQCKYSKQRRDKQADFSTLITQWSINSCPFLAGFSDLRKATNSHSVVRILFLWRHNKWKACHERTAMQPQEFMHMHSLRNLANITTSYLQAYRPGKEKALEHKLIIYSTAEIEMTSFVFRETL